MHLIAPQCFDDANVKISIGTKAGALKVPDANALRIAGGPSELSDR